MKLFTVILFFLPVVSYAQLNVIADLGGDDASPYFEAINKQQPESGIAPLLKPEPTIRQGLNAMLPVSTPEMTPGVVADRTLQLPGIGALFLVGDDVQSRAWLKANAPVLLARGAAGMIVNVDSADTVQDLRDLAPGIPLVPASGTELARRLQLQHYPVLITDSGLSQQVAEP